MTRKNEEKFALEALKIIDNVKYKNAYLSEIPDIQTVDKSVGVEIVRANFDELIISFKTIGKDIINAMKMNKDKPLINDEIEGILFYQRADKQGNFVSLQDAENCHYLYEVKTNKGRSIKEIIDYDDLREISKNNQIWEVENNTFDSLDDNYKVMIGRPVVKWVENWYMLFVERIDSKIEKFDTYDKFKEINLAIISVHNYDDDFQQVAFNLKNHYRDKYMPFDNIYLICGNLDKTIVLNFNEK